MNFELSDEQQLIRDTVRDFAEREIKPQARELDEKGEFSIELTKRIGEMGLFGMNLPEKYGGQGLGYLILHYRCGRNCTCRWIACRYAGRP